MYERGERNGCRFTPLRATSFQPPRPKTLAPGARWRGRFGGRFTGPRDASIGIVIASFSGGLRPWETFGWITDHVYDLALRRSRTIPGRVCR